MIKKLYITILFLFFINPVVSLNAQETLPELKPAVMIDDSVITLGDIFADMIENQDIVIGQAPEPGKKILISARHILKLTRAHNIRWRNSAGVKNVVVSRVSTVISYSELKPDLEAELKNLYHSSQNLDIRFYNRNGQIHLPNGFDAADMNIKNISLDKRSDKFSALIGAPTGSGGETLHTINGRIIRVTMIPSLARTLRSGDVITASDIKWISLPDSQVSRNMIRAQDKLIGMTPRTQIKEGIAIRLNEVNRPILVKRGALVKINFKTARISLSTIGKAIQKGGKGDVIQVKNNASQKIISAIILGPNQVEVYADASSLVLLN
ncbi:MAG: flagellar basal body P-ring formation protein FlgA [Emcibacteraceae bacterium]|nr:flagellar basal body P-ring formation protein FlgA [Emcibacteraceae bacterium]